MADIDLSGYTDVAARLRQFREDHPRGRMTSRILELPEPFAGRFVAVEAKAHRTVDDPLPGVGLAWEPVPGLTPYTKNSELMNAETSAWGRALVAALAVDYPTAGLASVEEVRNRAAEPKPPTPGATFLNGFLSPCHHASVWVIPPKERKTAKGKNRPPYVCAEPSCRVEGKPFPQAWFNIEDLERYDTDEDAGTIPNEPPERGSEGHPERSGGNLAEVLLGQVEDHFLAMENPHPREAAKLALHEAMEAAGWSHPLTEEQAATLLAEVTGASLPIPPAGDAPTARQCLECGAPEGMEHDDECPVYLSAIEEGRSEAGTAAGSDNPVAARPTDTVPTEKVGEDSLPAVPPEVDLSDQKALEEALAVLLIDSNPPADTNIDAAIHGWLTAWLENEGIDRRLDQPKRDQKRREKAWADYRSHVS